MAIDSNGNVYVTGSTTGSKFPSLNGKPTVTAGGHDAFVLKLNPAGQLAGSMLLGGQGDDLGNCLALGADGALYLTGVTNSSNFPTTAGVYQAQPPTKGFSVFLAKINSAAIGSSTTSPVIYSTYLEPGLAPLIAVDPSGNAYLVISTGLASLGTPGSFQSAAPPKSVPLVYDNLIVKINATGTTVLYATYFDGSGYDYANGLAVDALGSVYLSGTTTSPDLPTTGGSLQPNAPATLSYPGYGYTMGFLAKFSPDAKSLIYSTYLGGTGGYDYGSGVAVDNSGNAYIGGTTLSADFPVQNGIQVTLENSPCGTWSDPSSILPAGYQYCGSAGTLTVVNPQGNAIVWSTFLGYGSVADVALDSAGNVYATGIGIVLEGSTLASSPSNSVGVVKIAPHGMPVQFDSNGITNAASFNPGLPGPGGLATIFAHGVAVSGIVEASEYPLPTALAGVSIVVDGTPAPILLGFLLEAPQHVGTRHSGFNDLKGYNPAGMLLLSLIDGTHPTFSNQP